MASNNKNYIVCCPVCGLDITNDISLDLQKYMPNVNFSSIEDLCGFLDTHICPCCGTQFGLDDISADAHLSRIKFLRRAWIADGMKWKHQDKDSLEMKPKNWNPKKQLENIPKEFK